MASCARCGRPLPSFSLGELDELCRACRSDARRGAGASASDTGASAPAAAAAHASEAAASAPAAAPAAPPLPFPFVTAALIAICVLVFAATAAAGVPLLRPTSEHLLAWGADYGPRSLGDEPWRMLTSVFLHVGLLHLIVNMYALWGLGRLAELLFGRVTFLLLYLVMGVGASAFSLGWNPQRVSAGASGAIFGVAGLLLAALFLGHDEGGRARLRGTLRGLLAFAGYNLLIGWGVPWINNAAHIGGFLAGLACGAALVVGRGTPRTSGGSAEGVSAEAVSEEAVSAEGVSGDVAPSAFARRAPWALAGAAALVLAGVLAARAAHGHLAHVERAGSAYDRGAYDEAIAQLDRAGARVADDPWAQVLRGTSLLQLERLDEARAAIDRALALEPDYAYASQVKGVIALRQERFDEAIDILSALLEREPQLARVRAILGEALVRAGRLDEGIAALAQSVREQPDNPASRYQLGVAYVRAGRLEEADVLLEESVRLHAESRPLRELLEAVRQARTLHAEAQAATRP